MKSISPSEIEEGEERAAGFVLFRTLHQHRQYLLLRHRDGGHWSFPKGRLQHEEGELDAAIRETLEETQLSQIRPVPGFRRTNSYTVRRSGQERAKTVAYFLAETTESDVLLSDEHTAYQWLHLSEAFAALTHDENRRILAAADAVLAAVDEREQNKAL